jgi:hypothetical protein
MKTVQFHVHSLMFFAMFILPINSPTSILARIGLWRMHKRDCTATWFSGWIYLYASVEIFVHPWQGGVLTSALKITIPK